MLTNLETEDFSLVLSEILSKLSLVSDFRLELWYTMSI